MTDPPDILSSSARSNFWNARNTFFYLDPSVSPSPKKLSNTPRLKGHIRVHDKTYPTVAVSRKFGLELSQLQQLAPTPAPAGLRNRGELRHSSCRPLPALPPRCSWEHCNLSSRAPSSHRTRRPTARVYAEARAPCLTAQQARRHSKLRKAVPFYRSRSAAGGESESQCFRLWGATPPLVLSNYSSLHLLASSELCFQRISRTRRAFLTEDILATAIIALLLLPASIYPERHHKPSINHHA